MAELTESEDFYWEGGFLVFTAKYHLQRGSCCGSKCRHCPYEPRWTEGGIIVAGETEKPVPYYSCLPNSESD